MHWCFKTFRKAPCHESARRGACGWVRSAQDALPLRLLRNAVGSSRHYLLPREASPLNLIESCRRGELNTRLIVTATRSVVWLNVASLPRTSGELSQVKGLAPSVRFHCGRCAVDTPPRGNTQYTPGNGFGGSKGRTRCAQTPQALWVSHTGSAGNYCPFEIFKRLPFGATEFAVPGSAGTFQDVGHFRNVKNRQGVLHVLFVGRDRPIVHSVIVHNPSVWVVVTPFSVGFIPVVELLTIWWYSKRYRRSGMGAGSHWRKALGGQRNALQLGSRILVLLRHDVLPFSCFRVDRKCTRRGVANWETTDADGS